MEDQKKIQEFKKIQELLKTLIDAVDDKPVRKHDAGLAYNDVRKWYYTMQAFQRDAD